jgi:16S rRNA (cytidine1402-2'-O)-methyltransferase
LKLYRCNKNRVNKTPGTAFLQRAQQVGQLYVVAVPIGHVDDLTLRAHRILSEVDLVAAEHPEATRRLLAHHGITATVTSYGPMHLQEKVAVLVARLRQGARIALVSDCGTPVLSDPGCLLVSSAHSLGVPVIPVPGPSALTATVAASGFSCDSFFFRGRLPETRSGIRRCLVDWLAEEASSVIFCAPPSIVYALSTIASLAPCRRLALACDLTKPTEVIIRGTARQAQQRLAHARSARDITLMLAGRKPTGGRRKRMA